MDRTPHRGTENDSKDILEEFEFRPLSEGLGFYKKAPSLDNSLDNLDNSLDKRFHDNRGTRDNFESSASQPPVITQPLPRKIQGTSSPEQTRGGKSGGSNPTELLKLRFPKRPDLIENSPIKTSLGKSPPTSSNLQPTIWDPGAVFLDSLLLIAFYLLCLIGLIVTTHVDFFASLSQPDEQKLVYWSLAALFGSLTWIYLVASRIFLGATPGEWVFDQQLGTNEQIGSDRYAIVVVGRTTLTLITGLFLVPLISFGLNRDFIGQWMGVELRKKTLDQ